MKTWIKYAVFPGLVLFIFLVFRSCSLTDKYSVLKGRYEAYRTIAQADNEAKNRVLIEQKQAIIELQKKIDHQKIAAENTKKKIRQLDTAPLEEAYAKLTDNNEKIRNLETQVSVWKQKFTLAQEVIASQDNVIFNLEKKNKALILIAETYKEQLSSEQRLHALARELLGHAETKLKQRKAESTVKNMAIILLGGYVVYNAMKK